MDVGGSYRWAGKLTYKYTPSKPFTGKVNLVRSFKWNGKIVCIYKGRSKNDSRRNRGKGIYFISTSLYHKDAIKFALDKWNVCQKINTKSGMPVRGDNGCLVLYDSILSKDLTDTNANIPLFTIATT